MINKIKSLFSKRPNNLNKGQICADCGTTDCVTSNNIEITGPGVLHVRSSELMKTCKVRQQLIGFRKLINRGLIKNNC